ncbi:MAG: AHH domain-containing protein [Parasphingorhabdus sp.]|nr:AHH domain-containing protein [Parasphingorhabdus sp.]
MHKFSKVTKYRKDIFLGEFQRHHLLPVQCHNIALINNRLLALTPLGFSLSEFESNGIYLPSTENGAMRYGLPLHRGPHPRYNQLVMERLLRIFKRTNIYYSAIDSLYWELFRVRILQKALRLALLRGSMQSVILNKRDPMRSRHDLTLLDERIDSLWSATKDRG